MKDIKFRCWNAHGKVMHSWGELVEKNKIHLLANQKPSYVIMQYTGLKDKNGVEIFEGDVIDDKFSERQLKVIKWDSDSACFAYYCPVLDFSWQGISKTITEGEVIGNIHQNPELLS